MSDNAVWRGGGGQPGYYMCSHSGCQKKARNVDNRGRSPALLSGDHLCCGHSKHTTAHAYRPGTAKRPRPQLPEPPPLQVPCSC